MEQDQPALARLARVADVAGWPLAAMVIVFVRPVDIEVSIKLANHVQNRSARNAAAE